MVLNRNRVGKVLTGPAGSRRIETVQVNRLPVRKDATPVAEPVRLKQSPTKVAPVVEAPSSGRRASKRQRGEDSGVQYSKQANSDPTLADAPPSKLSPLADAPPSKLSPSADGADKYADFFEQFPEGIAVALTDQQLKHELIVMKLSPFGTRGQMIERLAQVHAASLSVRCTEQFMLPGKETEGTKPRQTGQ